MKVELVTNLKRQATKILADLHLSKEPVLITEHVDILPSLKDGDSLYRTAMPDRKNVLGRIDVAVVSDTTLTASPFSYSQT